MLHIPHGSWTNVIVTALKDGIVVYVQRGKKIIASSSGHFHRYLAASDIAAAAMSL